MRVLLGLISGLIFSLGLVISGMTNPAKVQNFLDLAGTWDPSLAFVMGGAIAVAAPSFYFIKRREKPILAQNFKLPMPSHLDRPLLAGSAIFGIGWGIGGLCPGPAISSLGMPSGQAFAFVAAMLLGMIMAKVVKAGQGSATASTSKA
ncbi:YeeE/YedE family protein [Rhodobacteraceae bacterium RKSG542]|uniref:DUF6691 family protein n=1 Tax=Pseudovibrio flavus TaxID=2529854 RepID=UPI0012BCCE6C|nr:DUF6691 family protein [Pseudovibrio flavus]MTI17993.1 YeeE/YedE family protein [Pseudovibrio flavus]